MWLKYMRAEVTVSELNRSNHSYLNLTKGVFTKGLVSCLTSLLGMRVRMSCLAPAIVAGS